MASVNQTRPHCVNQMGKTHSKPLASRRGRGTAWKRVAMCESAFSRSCDQQSLRLLQKNEFHYDVECSWHPHVISFFILISPYMRRSPLEIFGLNYFIHFLSTFPTYLVKLDFTALTFHNRHILWIFSLGNFTLFLLSLYYVHIFFQYFFLNAFSLCPSVRIVDQVSYILLYYSYNYITVFLFLGY
jgi:hypothetical protein